MTSSTEAKRALVISLDGLDARYLHERDALGLRIPTLRRLMSEGATARGVATIYPSVTYPVHTTIATSTYPAKHGIYGNQLFEPPDGPQTGDWHWFARDIKADTLWDAAVRANLTVGIVSWPVAAGAGDWNVPEILLPTFTNEEALARIIQHSRPAGFIQEVMRHDPALFNQVTRDEHDELRTRVAEYIIEAKRPHLLLVHLFDFDHWQHDYGPFSSEAIAILEKLDGYISRLISACERAGTLSETAIYIISDHGFVPISRLCHPNVLLAENGLLDLTEEKDEGGNAREIVTDWRAYTYPTGCSCAIILRDAGDAQTLERVRAVFSPLAGNNGSGIARVIEREELTQLNANSDAALMLEAADDFAFGTNCTGESVTPSVQRGQHGLLPDRYNASFIAAGRGIRPQTDLGNLRMIDIGPTVAHSLGLKLQDAVGEAIEGIRDEVGMRRRGSVGEEKET